MPSTLRVLPRGSALVPDYPKAAGGRNAFVGWAFYADGDEFVDHVTGSDGRTQQVTRRNGRYVKKVDEAVEVPASVEYLRHLRDGDLWPADEATAKAAGVKFDPTFGTEHPEATAALNGPANAPEIRAARAAAGLPTVAPPEAETQPELEAPAASA